MPANRKKLDDKLAKLGISKKNINLTRSPKTKAILEKAKKRKTNGK